MSGQLPSIWATFTHGYRRKPFRLTGIAQLDHHIRANTAALLESAGSESTRLRRVHSAQLRFLNVQSAIFDRRVTAGRVVDGHGDLRPEHIYVDGRPIVIDCLEFSEELRTVDIADELSFLAMECERLGDGGLERPH